MSFVIPPKVIPVSQLKGCNSTFPSTFKAKTLVYFKEILGVTAAILSL